MGGTVTADEGVPWRGAGLLPSLAGAGCGDGEEARVGGMRDPEVQEARKTWLGDSLGLRCSRCFLELESRVSFLGESCLHMRALPRGPDPGGPQTRRR